MEITTSALLVSYNLDSYVTGAILPPSQTITTNSETSPGEFISWYDYCCEIYRQANLNTKVIPVSTSEYGLSKAARPFNSRLDKRKLVEAGFKPLPDWKDAVKRYLAEANL